MEKELRSPVRSVKFFVAGLELSASSSMKIAFLGNGNKVQYSVVTLYNSLYQLNKKLDKMTDHVIYIKEKQDWMLDVSHQHHLIETSKIDELYANQFKDNASRLNAVDSSLFKRIWKTA